MPDESGQDLPVRVVLRCRPLITKELAEGCAVCLKFTPGEPQVILGKDKAFTYDYVFGPDAKQESLYKAAISGLVGGLFKGLNATVLAYGQTGSGKTFSMGNIYNLNDDEVKGVIPRVIHTLFDGIKERTETDDISVKVSYLEIYNEDIKDLLSSASKKDPLAIREVLDGGIKVAGLSEVSVNNPEDMMRCLEKGAVGRTTASTAMNATSSRSHAIFTVHMEMVKKDDSNNSCHAKFHLVDLAGSERAKKTKAQGDRFKEGVNINKGLLALGNVISALGDENGRKGHIPYRDAKLTRLLQDSLGGNSQTVMIACVSPADSNLEETLNTLRYADRARRIKNKPVVNRDPQAMEMARLRQQVQQLQIQLLQGDGGSLPVGSGDIGALQGTADLKVLLQRNQKLEAENHKLAAELQTAVVQTTSMCEKAILAEMSRDKIKQKLEELRSQADLSISALNVTVQDADQPDEGRLNILKELQKKIVDMQTDDKVNKEELYGEMETQSSHTAKSDTEGEGSSSGTSTSPPSANSHTLRQAQLSRELQEINKALAIKQDLAEKMEQNDDKLTIVKLQYESNVHQLEGEISTLQKEKEDLMSALNTAKATTSSNKISEQRRKRLKELEDQISQLKKKMVEQAKMLKLKDKSDKTVTKLNTEIRDMKQIRVRLMKQMKGDATKWQQFKNQKDKEVMQLKAKERKRQCEYSKLENQHKKQQVVMRRKMEEASAANKRLKDALLKQKTAASKKDERNEKNMHQGIGKRIRGWLDHEVEIMVSVREAKHHLASLLNDRKVISHDLVTLQQKEQEEPPSKKMATPGKSIHISDRPTSKRIFELKQELELRNIQIADLQQEIVDADQDDKRKSRWSRLTTMIEAKCGLQFLLDQAVNAKSETSRCHRELQDVKASLADASKEIEEVREERSEVEKSYEEQLTTMQRTYEDKVLYLLSQLPKVSGKADSTPNATDIQTRLKFQDEVISEMKNVHEQLQDTATENEDLKKQLTLASYSAGGFSTGKKMSLMPTLVSPDATPDFSKPKKKRSFKKKSVALPQTRYTLDEFMDDKEWDSGSDEDDDDSDWHETPKFKRRAKRSTSEISNNNVNNNKNISCQCKSSCNTKRCKCNKTGKGCGSSCKCDPTICVTRRTMDDSKDDGDTSSSSTIGTCSPAIMNTTVTLESDNSQNGSPLLFKTPTSPKRNVLKDVNKNRKRSDTFAKSSSQQQPATSKFPSKKNLNKTINDPLYKKKRSTEGGIANQGIANRKRKLLSMSHSNSFFKPLTES